MNTRQSLEAFGMYIGTVLTPDLARTFGARGKVKEPAIEGYGLVGWMSARMHEQINTNPENIGWRLTAFETPLEQILLVVTVQAGCCQMRFLAHLADPKVREMLKWSAQRGYMQLLLGVPEKTYVIRYYPPFFQEDLAPLLVLSSESRGLPTVLTMVEFAESAAELIYEKDNPACFGMATATDVTVTSILWHKAPHDV